MSEHLENRGSIPGRHRRRRKSLNTFKTVTGSEGSTAKRVSVTRLDMTIINPCHNRCGTLKNPPCSMAMKAEHRSKFEALHRQR